MINCNPETVSTDYDNTDYLYFEELSLERVLDIYDLEKAPCVVSVGGQIPNNLAPQLATRNIALFGSNAKMIIKAEDRGKFSHLLDTLGIAQPQWSEAHSLKQSLATAKSIGFPILIRPSFVLSGKAMLVIETEEQLTEYLLTVGTDFREHALVMTKFLQGAKECDFDGVAKNGTLIISALSEHVEKGGVHSGDATLVLPAMSLSNDMQNLIKQNSETIIKALKVSGPFNIQYLVSNNKPYVIECNLRASRSIPFVSKAMKHNFIAIATQIALGENVKPIRVKPLRHITVKAPQFSFRRLRGADPVLRVEMSSTGEVAAFGKTIHEAYLKALFSTGVTYPVKKAVFLSLGGIEGKKSFLSSSSLLADMGYTLYATGGTYAYLETNGIKSICVEKLHEQKHPNYLDLLREHKIGFSVVLQERFSDTVKTIVEKGASDGYLMRRMSVDLGLLLFTNAETARLFIESIHKYQLSDLEILSWNEYKE